MRVTIFGMRGKISTFLIAFALTISPTFAIQEVNQGDILTLDKCIEIAINNSPTVNKAKNQVRIARANVSQAKARWSPALGAGVGWNGSNSRVHHHSSHNRHFGVDAGISQMIYDFGKTNASINMQKFNLVATQFELEQMILDTAYNVKEAYYAVLAAKAKRDVQVQNVEINERYYEQIKAYFEEGIRSRIDFVNAEVNLSDAKYSMLSADDEFCDAMVRLNKALYLTTVPEYSIAPVEKFNVYQNETPTVLIHHHDEDHDHEVLQEEELKEISLTGIIKENEIVKEHKIDKFNKTFEEALEIAQANRPDLKSYMALKDASGESLKMVRRQWFPELSANAGYNFGREHGENSNSISYGAELSIPMVRPASVKFELDAAHAEHDNAFEDIKLIQQDIYYDVQLALCETKIHENQIPLILERVRLAKENFELANGRYMEGIGNYIELQDARSQYLNAQQEYIRTVYNYSLARADLDYAMGVK